MYGTTNLSILNKFEKNWVYNMSIATMRAAFLKLDKELKAFGKTKCKHNRLRHARGKKLMIECDHPSMAYGGMTRNTDCELENCPRVLYGDEET